METEGALRWSFIERSVGKKYNENLDFVFSRHR